MQNPFQTYRQRDNLTEAQKQPPPESLELGESSHSPCSFMPRHSYSMMMSPATNSGRAFIQDNYKNPGAHSQTHGNLASDEGTKCDGRTSRSDTTASSANPTPTSEDFPEVDTIVGGEGKFWKTLEDIQFRCTTPLSGISLICLFCGLIALVIACVIIGLEGLSFIAIKFFGLALSVLDLLSVSAEWGLESIGFLIGRAVAMLAKGFFRGYHFQ